MAEFEAPVALFDLGGLVHIGNYLVVLPFDGDSLTYSLERSLILTGELDSQVSLIAHTVQWPYILTSYYEVTNHSFHS